MTQSVLIGLERAEVAARERRLAASAEAERRVAAAHAEAERIGAGTEAEVRTALEARRREHADRAAAEIAAIEAEVAAMGDDGGAGDDGSGDGTCGPSPADPAEARAVDLVVSVVLGEREA